MHNKAEKLRQSSLYVRQWLNSQPSVKEESITDWLLYDISANIDGIYSITFTRHEEARKTGADWEWWFVFRNFAIKIRVQAKKLKLDVDNYSSLAYTNQYGLQIEKLLKDSEDENFLPLYALYTPLARATMCGKNILDEGVYLAGGRQIYHDFILNGKVSVNDSELLQKSNPLSCILGCPANFESDKPLVEYFTRYFQTDVRAHSETENSNQRNDGILGYHSEPPSYVNSFLEYSTEGLPDWWEGEFRHFLQNIDALVVYDGRDSENFDMR